MRIGSSRPPTAAAQCPLLGNGGHQKLQSPCPYDPKRTFVCCVPCDARFIEHVLTPFQNICEQHYDSITKNCLSKKCVTPFVMYCLARNCDGNIYGCGSWLKRKFYQRPS